MPEALPDAGPADLEYPENLAVLEDLSEHW